MNDTSTITALHEQVRRVIDDNRRLRKEIEALQADREKVAGRNKIANERIAELEKRLQTVETAGSLAGLKADNKAARLRVNKLLREIDSCIAMLNK